MQTHFCILQQVAIDVLCPAPILSQKFLPVKTGFIMNIGFLYNRKVIKEKQEMIMKSDHSVHNKTIKWIHVKVLGVTVKKRRITSVEPHYK